MIKIRQRIYKYRIGKYFLYIFINKENIEAYIQEKNNEIISMMWRVQRSDYSLEEVEDIIKATFPREAEYYHERFNKED